MQQQLARDRSPERRGTKVFRKLPTHCSPLEFTKISPEKRIPYEKVHEICRWRRTLVETKAFGRKTLKKIPEHFLSPVVAFCWTALLLLAPAASAQLFSFPKSELIDYTAQNPFNRFPDGRPKVPDDLLERARGLSAEEIWEVLDEKGFKNQYADGFHVLHPDKTMVGRAFTVQFMPLRPDVGEVLKAKAKEHGVARLNNQTAIDMLQPGDVLVVDLFGKKTDGTIVGDNLFYYVMQATHGAGLVVDGSVRDLDGISEIPMPAYFRAVDPTPIGNVMLTAINTPVRIGTTTVMPGDLVVGDREGVYFVPPQFVEEVLNRADEIHIHDEWTKKKFAEGKYKSSEIYSSPTDPKLQQEYHEYLKKRLDEIHRERDARKAE
jgi:4-hydroxy-4-methyl-2-oxoglutarate aldolase